MKLKTLLREAIQTIGTKKPINESKFKKGDTVLPTTGPHKDVPHKIIAVLQDVNKPTEEIYNIQPIGLKASQIKYRLGAVAARASQLVSTGKSVNEKINFVLGPTIHGDPNKPMKDDFKIAFKDPRKAIMTIMKINKDLESRGLKPVDYDNMGIVFKKPSNQQMQFILNAFDSSDVESVGRVLK